MRQETVEGGAGAKVRLTIYRVGSEYFSSRTFPDHPHQHQDFPNVIFTQEETVTADDMEAFENKARLKAGELGLGKVVNLTDR